MPGIPRRVKELREAPPLTIPPLDVIKKIEMNTSKYPSKIDLWIILLLVAIPLFLIGWGIATLGDGLSGILTMASGIIVAISMVIFLIPLHYTITEESLEIRYGIIKEKVNFKEIKEVKPTSDLTSAPALSLQRVEIVLEDKSKLVSPQNRDQFIQELQKKISR